MRRAPPVTALPEIGNHGLATAPLVLQGLRDPQTPYDGVSDMPAT